MSCGQNCCGGRSFAFQFNIIITCFTSHRSQSPGGIQEQSSGKDLGTADLKVSRGSVVKQHRRLIPGYRYGKLVSRQFKNLHKKGFLILYKGFQRPHLEYAIHTWSTYLRGDIDRLEKVQRIAKRLVSGYKKFPWRKVTYSLGQTTQLNEEG